MNVSFVRSSVIDSLNLAALTTNGGFLGCAAAWLTSPIGRSVRCLSEGRDFNTAASGSDRTDALQNRHSISPPT